MAEQSYGNIGSLGPPPPDPTPRTPSAPHAMTSSIVMVAGPSPVLASPSASPATPAGHDTASEQGVPAWVLWVLIGVCGLAGVMTGLLALGIVTGLSRRANAYHDLPEVQVHVGVLLAQVAFWFIAAPLLLVWHHQLKDRWEVQTSSWHVAPATISLSALIFVPLLLGRGQNQLPR